MKKYTLGIDNNTFNVLTKVKRTKANEDGLRKIKIANILEKFTIIVDKPIRRLLNKKLFSYISFNKDNKKYHYQDYENSLDFEMYSDFVSGKKARKELTSIKRYKKFHNVSFAVALYTINHNISVLTGYLQTPYGDIYHSVVEDIDSNGNKIIRDSTKNIVMKEEDYINVFNFKVINKISTKDVKDDYKYYLSKTGKIPLSVYFVFRDEMINDLNNKGWLKLPTYIKGINKNTYDLLTTDTNNYDYDLYYDKVQDTIEASTLSKKYQNYFLSSEKDTNLNFVSYDKDTKKYTYNDGITEFRYRKLSSLMPEDELLIKHKKELETTDRYRHCHENSIYIAGLFNNSKVSTGCINIHGKNILHSVVEFEENGNEYIVDYNKNIIMNKKDYLNITNFRLLQSSTLFELRNELDILKNCLGFFEGTLFMCFRDELMKDLKKNSKVLKLQD